MLTRHPGNGPMAARDIIAKYETQTAEAFTRRTQFNPFTGRLARDIRNTLSRDLVGALSDMNPDVYRQTAERWQQLPLVPDFLNYIRDRVERYDGVYLSIRSREISDPLDQAVVIWNARLYFEFHEHLEQVWHPAGGDLRPALQGLIKAAGYYIHLEAGNGRAARRIGAKAAVLLDRYGSALETITNLGALTAKLKKGEPEAVLLEQN